MENTKKLSKSLRKHIRTEKARIRREFFDKKEQEKKIEKLYNPDKPVKKAKPSSSAKATADKEGKKVEKKKSSSTSADKAKKETKKEVNPPAGGKK